MGGRLLQDAQTTGNGNVGRYKGASGEYSFFVIPNGTVSGGTVRIEEAGSEDYSGTWTEIATISPSTGALQTVKVSGSYEFVRARITSDITGGGTVTVKGRGPRFGGK